MSMIIGITGSFGSGKTTVAEMFGSLGAYVIDADRICHGLMLPGKKVYGKIVRHFGSAILRKDKGIDRSGLADIVFADSAKLRLLDRLIHPDAIKEINSIIRRRKGRGVVVVDAALIVESGLGAKLDVLIVVKTKMDRHIHRLTRAKGIRREDIVRRIRSQAPLKKKLALADFVIDNSGSKKQTRAQVIKIWEQLRGAGVSYGRKSKTGY